MRTLEGRVAIVTGGAAGLGLAIARALATRGSSVAIVDVDADAGEKAASVIAKELGVPARGAVCDVGDVSSVERAVAEITARLGPPGILVNNAGIMAPRLVPTEVLEPEEFDRMMTVHVRGTFLASRAVLGGMKQRRFGRIVNLSSVLGLVGVPFRAAYSTAKTAIIGFTRGLALEAARYGVTVNAVAPGYILTDTLRRRVSDGVLDHDRFAERTPVGRWGQPEEISRAVAFLAEPGSGYITGTTLVVDGGFSIRGDANEFIGERAAI